MTFRDGALPYHNLLLSIKSILATIIENIKSRHVETVIMVVLIHKPEIRNTRNVWIGRNCASPILNLYIFRFLIRYSKLV